MISYFDSLKNKYLETNKQWEDNNFILFSSNYFDCKAHLKHNAALCYLE